MNNLKDYILEKFQITKDSTMPKPDNIALYEPFGEGRYEMIDFGSILRQHFGNTRNFKNLEDNVNSVLEWLGFDLDEPIEFYHVLGNNINDNHLANSIQKINCKLQRVMFVYGGSQVRACYTKDNLTIIAILDNKNNELFVRKI